VPTLDHYRKRWPEVEVDIRLGNSFEPIKALAQQDIDLVITTDKVELGDIAFEPLFDYEALCIMANDHGLTAKNYLQAEDFSDETLITYPVEKQRLDIFTHFLNPQKKSPKQIRQSELTVMILQLVASGRGIAVLPDWVVKDYIERDYVSAKPLGKKGMRGTLFAAVRQREVEQEYLKDFILLAREGLYLRR
jgi:LysR family transcriptional regulator for metE and metH